ncbi:MAG: nucleoside 2-deoxyribosyltransferase [Firmicutes bacterium]|nr:nucleoside 2-deoxyribosyltransferase [Bacillota bacterium]MCL1953882.1 nucleoside 2-deoxyribosyltransferase [Bacillota bacterium]
MNSTGTVRGIKNWDIITTQNLQSKLDSISNNIDNIIKDIPKYTGKKQKIYFAAPWFDDNSFAMMKWIENAVDILQPYSRFDVYFPRQHDGATPKDTFYQNVNAIKDADTVVAWISPKDVGTAWEIGMAYTLGKHIILLGYDQTCFSSHISLMFAYNGRCIVLDNFIKLLLGNLQDDDCVEVDNLWEGKE